MEQGGDMSRFAFHEIFHLEKECHEEASHPGGCGDWPEMLRRAAGLGLSRVKVQILPVSAPKLLSLIFLTKK